MVIINEIPGQAVKERGAAKYPDDFPHLQGTDKSFVAWREDGQWHVETTLSGEALQQELAALPKDHSFYKVSGIRDSAKEGWFKDSQTARIEVETPLGVIIAEVAGDREYPGIYLSFRRYGESYEQTAALLESNEPGNVRLLVWRDEKECDEYSHEFPIEHGEVL